MLLRPATCRSRTKPRSESQVVDIKLADFQIAEVDSVDFLFNLFKSDVFATEDLTDEDPTLMPTDVSCIIHTSSLEVSGIDIGVRISWRAPLGF